VHRGGVTSNVTRTHVTWGGFRRLPGPRAPVKWAIEALVNVEVWSHNPLGQPTYLTAQTDLMRTGPTLAGMPRAVPTLARETTPEACDESVHELRQSAAIPASDDTVLVCIYGTFQSSWRTSGHHASRGLQVRVRQSGAMRPPPTHRRGPVPGVLTLQGSGRGCTECGSWRIKARLRRVASAARLAAVLAAVYVMERTAEPRMRRMRWDQWISAKDVWADLRATRSQPPGRASANALRRAVYQAALKQAEQLFTAAERVSTASRPLWRFTG
jgi:hypothetical protein